MSRSNSAAVALPSRPARTKQGVWTAGGVALLLALGAGLAVWWRADRAQQSAKEHAARAVDMRGRGDLAGAVRELQTATRLDPRSGQAWYLLAKAREEQRAGTGLSAYEKAVALSPQNAEVLRDAGVALHAADQTARARVLLEQAVRLAPTDQAAHAGLGRAYLARVTGPEDLRLGVQALTTALNLQPGDVQTRYRLARALYQNDDLEKARQQFSTTLGFLAEGARRVPELMDGRSFGSVTWLSIVKGCHHHLAQIARRRAQPQTAAAHQRLFDDIHRYIRDTDGLFTALKKKPEDGAAQRQLRELYVRYRLPAAGPNGKAAAARWIGR